MSQLDTELIVAASEIFNLLQEFVHNRMNAAVLAYKLGRGSLKRLERALITGQAEEGMNGGRK